MKAEKKKPKWSLTLLFSVIIFANIFIILTLLSAIMSFLINEGIMYIVEDRMPEAKTVIPIAAAVSLVLGYGISLLTAIFPLKPIDTIITEMNRLASGDFDARIEFSPAVKTVSVFKNVSESFNKLAEDLKSTEMLRSDFINNFSHEFKTPIASIAGFAEIIENCDLSDEERRQYAGAIREESRRLSYMATNVLQLTKIENQSVLAETTDFNLSEQIRSAVLLLEGKWTEKDISLDIDFTEHNVVGNEELLKQVWINLIDNAIKFADESGVVSIRIEPKYGGLSVVITNTGKGIPEDKIDRIFGKFYQADESHSTEGNGIGLAIVKKIIDLHSGRISVESGGGVTVFSVYLPEKQPVP